MQSHSVLREFCNEAEIRERDVGKEKEQTHVLTALKSVRLGKVARSVHFLLNATTTTTKKTLIGRKVPQSL